MTANADAVLAPPAEALPTALSLLAFVGDIDFPAAAVAGGVVDGVVAVEIVSAGLFLLELAVVLEIALVLVLARVKFCGHS